MDKKVLDFLAGHQVGVLAVLRNDQSPHAATLHYSHQNKPLELYFSTENTSRKIQALLSGQTVKGSFVAGFSEEEWITVQMDGEVSAVLDADELKAVHAVHYAKHPNSEKYKDDPATIFLKFIPTWWRHTDYNTDPPTILSSHAR